MTSVRLSSVEVEHPVAKFTDQFSFIIEFDCVEELQDDLEWKLTYVGSSDTKQHDQVLESLLVGPIPVGKNKFQFTAPAPNSTLIPAADLLGASGCLLSCSYKNQEFVQVGYYINNEYTDEELKANPPATPIIDKIQRTILTSKPRVTTFPINWGNATSEAERKKMEEDLQNVVVKEEDVIQDDEEDEGELEDENEAADMDESIPQPV